ncbi:16S rRNA pseudouridine(516) synthase RsuA [Pseudoalteromonas sp. C2R02]|uniref:16S rRNA pseudouridine(516) synthase RsuA n=1 Tax=Pseudoalteromonas sp. C2R02 TaxID=2841565 RepID=UPI001C095A0C|nr:16S rRNA pseudouridine(516) synthase RsuA [Pseudoalteromonas sp. C2R02]MBU2969894.1 16S rRNA pseudouridine(516) synthase RsuA [Pseudoalteromonas sp. C2R02]
MKFPCRLDKFISHLAETPRTKAKAAIKRKFVTVNDEVIRSFDYQVKPEDVVMFKGEQLVDLGKRYYMLNKPEDYVCANSDEMHATVFELLNEPKLSELHIAGRLDIDTTGLVLITNDGDWSHRATSPRHQKFKTYLVETETEITDQEIAQLEEGVMLHGEKAPTLPAKVEKIAGFSLKLSIQEGKYHQVKRMLAAVGNSVAALHREQVSDISLGEDLAPGEYRTLTEDEINCI